MAINGVWNKRCGPGGSARRLHQYSAAAESRGRNRLDTRGKDASFARHGSAVIGPTHKCQRQRGARCRRINGKRGSGGTGQQKPPNSLSANAPRMYAARSLCEAMMSDERQPPESLLPYDAWTEE